MDLPLGLGETGPAAGPGRPLGSSYRVEAGYRAPRPCLGRVNTNSPIPSRISAVRLPSATSRLVYL